MELFTGEKRKQKNKMKKKKKIIIGILIAAVIAAAGITWYVMNQKNQKTGNSSAEVIAWDVDIEEEEPSQEKGILIPGYTSMVTSVYKGYKRDKIEMRGDRAEISDFPLYLNTVAGGLDCRDQTIGGFSFVVKIYAVPVVEIIG